MTQPPQTTSPSSPSNYNARQIAFDILEDVLTRRSALDHTLERHDDFLALDTRDKRFVRMLTATTLRRLGQIDDLITKAQDRPDALKIERLRHILRLGVTQVLFMDVPDHAAVDSSVSIARTIGMDKQSGFVNAILRTIIKNGQNWISKQDSIRLNTPEWLLKIWIEDYGFRHAAEIAQANQAEAPLDITVKDPESHIYWSNALQATQLPTKTLRKASGGSVTDFEGFKDGAWWVQDAAAAIPAQLFGPITGKTVLDMCAAPGGKTAQLATQGAHVIACDRAPKRVKKMEQNLERLDLLESVTVEIADAGQFTPKTESGLMSYILIDAPCTATGTLRRHPDVAHLKDPKDIDRLTHVQRTILNHAFKILEPGGVLIYCTCSLQKAEGERQIEAFLNDNKNAQRIPIRKDELDGYEEPITEHGDLRVLPYHNAALGGMDGFYVARLTKA